LSLNILRRSTLLAAIPAILLGAAMPADAASAVGFVSVTAGGPSGSASGRCVYSATLPDTSDFNSIEVAFSGTAEATPSAIGVVAVSTSIRCYLRNMASGSNGITMIGSAAAIAGTGSVYRLAPDPEICAVVSAAFSDGTTTPSVTNCVNL
jgi:hypothetical protein